MVIAKKLDNGVKKCTSLLFYINTFMILANPCLPQNLTDFARFHKVSGCLSSIVFIVRTIHHHNIMVQYFENFLHGGWGKNLPRRKFSKYLQKEYNTVRKVNKLFHLYSITHFKYIAFIQINSYKS